MTEFDLTLLPDGIFALSTMRVGEAIEWINKHKPTPLSREEPQMRSGDECLIVTFKGLSQFVKEPDSVPPIQIIYRLLRMK